MLADVVDQLIVKLNKEIESMWKDTPEESSNLRKGVGAMKFHGP